MNSDRSNIITAAMLESVGNGLQKSLTLVMADGAEELPRPTDLARRLQLDRTLCSRMRTALRKAEALQVLHALPSPKSLRLFLTAAAKEGEERIGKDLIEQALSSVLEFEQTIAQVGGKKANLDTLIGRLLETTREKNEHTSKQNLFRGASNMYGVTSECALLTRFVLPSKDSPEQLSQFNVYGAQDLCRLRPDRAVMLGGYTERHNEELSPEELKKRFYSGEVEGDGYPTLWSEFCSKPTPPYEILEADGTLIYFIPENEDITEPNFSFIHAHQACDLPRFGKEGLSRITITHASIIPTKLLQLEMFIHNDLHPDIIPKLRILRPSHGVPRNKLTSRLFELDFCENLERLGSDIRNLNSKHVRDYEQIIAKGHEITGCKLGDYQLYRCEIRYPVMGIDYGIQIVLPECPSESP